MRYQEYKPPVELAPWIKLFWVFENVSNEPVPETIVADGFPELIVHFRAPFAELEGGGSVVEQPVAVACGQLTRPLVLHGSSDAGMIGIRFQPGGMAPFVSAPMDVLTDARVPAEALFDGVERFAEAIVNAPGDAQRLAACERFLFRSIDPAREDRGVRRAVECILRTGGGMAVPALASQVGMSRRSLEMAFRRTVGTSPKMYCRIARFRHAYDAVSTAGARVDWGGRAVDSGFFDQSHLIRDFRRFAGTTPTAYLAERTSFADSVNQGS